MPVQFSNFPDHIKLACIKKLEWLDFLNFRFSSRSSLDISEQVENQLLLHVEALVITEKPKETTISLYHGSMYRYLSESEKVLPPPKRIIQCLSIDVKLLDDQVGSMLLKCFHQGWICESILFRGTGECCRKLFNTIVERSKAKTITTRKAWNSVGCKPLDYLKQPAVQKLACLNGEAFFNNEALLSFSIHSLNLSGTTATSAGINSLLLEWKSAKRVIKSWYLEGKFPQFNDRIMLMGLPARRVSPLGNEWKCRQYEVVARNEIMTVILTDSHALLTTL